MRSAAGSLRRIAAVVVVLTLLAVNVVALDAGPAGAAALQDGCEVAGDTGGSGVDPCDCLDVDAAGEGIGPCFDPCEITSAGTDPCAETPTPTATPDPCAPTKGDDNPCEPEPCGDVVASGGEVDPCATATPSPTPDPCAPTEGDVDPCEPVDPCDDDEFSDLGVDGDPCVSPSPTLTLFTATPVPPDSCNVGSALGALGAVDCETPEATATATEDPPIEEPATDDETPVAVPDAAATATATATPAPRGAVTSLPNTGVAPGADRQPPSTLPLLAAVALLALALVGTLARRRLVR